MRVLRVAVCFFIVLAIFGCGGSARPVRQRVLLPPTLNLVPHHNIGLFQFSVENAKGTLHEFATRRFEEYVLAAQSGIEMREFMSADSARVFASGTDTTSCPVAFFGHLKISNVKPLRKPWKPPATTLRSPPRSSASAAKRCLKSVKNTACNKSRKSKSKALSPPARFFALNSKL